MSFFIQFSFVAQHNPLERSSQKMSALARLTSGLPVVQFVAADPAEKHQVCRVFRTMLAHSDLRTLTLHTDWDDSLVSELGHVALFYCENGFWDRLKDEALYLLGGFNGDASELHRPLRRAFNAWLLEVQKHDFDFGAGEALGDLAAAEQRLATEMLDYHADPEMYLIVHAVDEDRGDDAWFLCYLSDIEDLGLDKTLTA